MRVRRYGGLVVLSLLIALSLAGGVASAAKLTLTIWDYAQERLDLLQQYTEQYSKLNPGIEFQLQLFGSYWDKVPTAIAAGTPPDIFWFHNSHTSELARVLEPFPEDLFPLAKMKAEYFAFDQAFLLGKGDRQFHFLPAGVMLGVIFYNQDLWDAGGVASAPTTWDELRTVARKLTRRRGDDRLEIAGFCMRKDIRNILVDMVFQQGGWLFNEDGTQANIDTPEARRALDLIAQMLFGDRVSDLPSDSGFEMSKGNAVMQYKWPHYRRTLDKVDSLRYAAFAVPTLTGSRYPSVGRNNYESGFAVPKGADRAHRDEAFRFLQWLYEQDSYLMAVNISGGRIPPKPRLWRNDEVRSDGVTALMAAVAPYTVFPGELPVQQWQKPLDELANALLKQSNAPGVLLEEAQRLSNARLAETPAAWVVERPVYATEVSLGFGFC